MPLQPNILTYSDAIDQLVDYLGGAGQDAEQRLSRRCVQNAYRELISRRAWRHLYDHRRVQLNAYYSTGTIAYTHSTRTVALSDGTFPSWVGPYARIRINTGANAVYICQVNQLVNSTSLTLTANLNPGQDVAASTTYTIFQDVYPMGADFRMANEPTAYSTWGSQYIRFTDWQWLEWHANSQGNPVRWTIGPDPVNPGGYAMYVAPYPSTAIPYDFTIQRRGRTIFWTGYESAARTGTVTVSASGTTVTGSGTGFTSAMAGAIIRFSGTSGVPDGQGGLNPYYEQKLILSVTDTTHLTLANSVDSAYAGKGFVISDPIDFPEMLIEAFLQGCRWQYSVMGRTDQMKEQERIYNLALIHACESDNVVEIDRVVGQLDKRYDRGWYTGTAVITPP